MAEWIAEFVAFLVMVFLLWRYVVPPLRKIMRSQQDLVRKQVEDARRASERLAEAERRYSEVLAEARTEAAKIRDQARADAQVIVEEMRAFAHREVDRIRQRGEEDLATQRQQVIRELRTRVGELAVSSAREQVTQHLSDDARRMSTVDRLLDELEAMAGPREPEPAAKSGAGRGAKAGTAAKAGRTARTRKGEA
jgi:F-type H+-transporting ATPase subunit b